MNYPRINAQATDKSSSELDYTVIFIEFSSNGIPEIKGIKTVKNDLDFALDAAIQEVKEGKVSKKFTDIDELIKSLNEN